MEAIYTAVRGTMAALGVPAEFKTPLPVNFGAQVKMLTPSLNPDTMLPQLSGPLAGISISMVSNLVDIFRPGAADTVTRYALGKYAVDQSTLSAFLPAHINRLYAAMDQNERDSQYASAWRKAVTYLEASGNGIPKRYEMVDGVETLIPPSAAELEDRIATAQNRVVNAPPQVKEALQRFYPDINNSDILAYTLDPEKGLADIKRKITAAEIGGAAIGAGLATSVTRAEELAKFGVTAEKARQGYQAAVPIIERGRQLADFYQESPYTQGTAEEEIFGLTYAPEAAAKRKRLTGLEEAQFSGRAGMTGGALARDRAGAY
jgi:hypothetical protein